MKKLPKSLHLPIGSEHLIYDHPAGGNCIAVLEVDGEHVGPRIVSCYNACAGLNPEAVPELVAALEEIRKHLYNTQDVARCRALAEAALLKAKQP